MDMPEQTLDEYLDVLLASTLAYLRSSEPYSTADHSTLMIDLGWDVQSGDGRIVEALCELLEGVVDRCPPALLNWLWWQTSSGRVEARCIERELAGGDLDFSGLGGSAEEIRCDITDLLKARLLVTAENDYDEFVESEMDS
jgi:hypothetical protein